MLKQVFLVHFEPVVTRFGPLNLPKCLEKGLVQDQKWVKNGSKTCFSKSDCGPVGRLKQVFLAWFEPEIARFGPWRIPKCLVAGNTMQFKASPPQFQTFLVAKSSDRFRLPSVGVPNVQVYS